MKEFIKKELIKKSYFGIITMLFITITFFSVYGNSKNSKDYSIIYTYNTFTTKFPNIYPSMPGHSDVNNSKIKDEKKVNGKDKISDKNKNIDNKKSEEQKKLIEEEKRILEEEQKKLKQKKLIEEEKKIAEEEEKKRKNKKIDKQKKKKYNKKINKKQYTKIYYYKDYSVNKFDLNNDLGIKIKTEGNIAYLNSCKFEVKEHTFIDDKDTFATKYISFLQKLGIVNGINGEGKIFSPESKITRIDFLKITLKSLCLDYDNVVSNNIFSDVEQNDWKSKVITKALEKNIISDKDKSFRPDEPITRIEAMKILFNASNLSLVNVKKSSFEDIKEIGDIKIIETAKKANIINGKIIEKKLMFEPNKELTRAESAKIIVLLLKELQIIKNK